MTEPCCYITRIESGCDHECGCCVAETVKPNRFQLVHFKKIMPEVGGALFPSRYV